MFWSDRRFVVLRRDLSQAIEHPKAPVAFSIRPYEPGDAATLFDADSPDDQAERRKLESWMERGLKSCYVAVLEDGRATFMQWLCTPSDNKPLRDIFGGALPVVEPGTVLLEGAYTPPRFRRLPVMPAAMARIAEEGRRLGARWALVSVGEDNASMIRAAQWAGFTPWRLTSDRRRLFRRFRQLFRAAGRAGAAPARGERAVALARLIARRVPGLGRCDAIAAAEAPEKVDRSLKPAWKAISA